MKRGLFRHKQHYYDNSSYYFITADLGEGKRINSFQSLSYSDTVITSLMITKFTKMMRLILLNLV